MRILIVEDEPRKLELLRKGLYESGFTVMTAPDGRPAWQWRRRMHSTPSCWTSACRGWMIWTHAEVAHACTTPVLVLTARDTEDDIIRGLDPGADDYLTKPLSFPAHMPDRSAPPRSLI
jgi:DNA-binding response OmpR family regulator